MKRLVLSLVSALLVVVSFWSAGAFAQDGPTVRTAVAPDIGMYLVDPEGMTLYMFTRDTQGAGTSVCNDDCATNWPPFTAEEPLALPEDVPGELTLITRDDGTMQVAYNGWPLYYFAEDTAPGDITGHGAGDVWFVAAVVAAGATPVASPMASPVASPAASPAAEDGQASEVTVNIEDFAFNEANLPVSVGTTVTWVNNDSAPHTSTAEDGTWDSGTLETGDSFSFTFEEAGEYPYVCAIHPSMMGSVTVTE